MAATHLQVRGNKFSKKKNGYDFKEIQRSELVLLWISGKMMKDEPPEFRETVPT